MIHYSWKSIKNNKKSSFLIIFSLIAIFITAPITISALFEIQSNVDDNIQEYARGSYDILIRPTESQTKVEKLLGKVEENYLSYGEGGISLNEWEKIKNLKDVEIAAPVASLGYFTGEDKTLSLAYPSTSSYIDLTFSTFDGVNEYTFPDKSGYFYMLEQDNVYDKFDFYGESGLSTYVMGTKPIFLIPTTYHLTVGVDKEEEEKLTGINLSALDNQIPVHLKDNYDYLEVKRDIPIISLADSFIPLMGQANVFELEWNIEETLELKEQMDIEEDTPFFLSEQYSTMPDILSNIKRISEQNFEIPLFNFMKPFFYDPLSFEYDGTFSEELNFSFGITETSKFYSTRPIDYDIGEDGILVAQKVGSDSGVPTYREVVEHGASTYEYFASENETEIPFLLYPVGTFTTQNYQDSLASSPLGIYQQAPSVTAEEGVTLHETITPGSFVSSPAHGIMSLEDAAYIKGDNPIDAIRLKVGGVAGYNEEAEKKINEVVVAISKIGDYDISIVAGASPSNIVLNVEDIGLVEQAWTSLGAAATISDGWNTTNQLISGLFITISFLYVLNQGLFKKYAKTDETATLHALGWASNNIKRFHLMESYLLILFSIVISAIFLISFYIIEFIEVLTLIVFIVVGLITSLITWLNLTFTKRKSFEKFEGIKFKRTWLRNIFFYKKLLSISVLQLICASLLVNFIPVIIYLTNQETGETSLGVHINDIIFFLVIIVLGATLYLVTTTIMESIYSFLNIRKKEIVTLRDVGWRLKDVRNVFMKEFLAWIIPSLTLGMIINLLIFQFLFTVSLGVIFISLVITIALSCASFIIALTVVRRTLKTLQV
ncbi:ABC transporter permease [Alkalicoccobacillus gibsonii]|uniref:ABC transporter permease n=1 Tax=Alkalicoccobacillus gibsonii TaxID=79881 RepID=UPI0019336FDB|nr:hypothetical protein [Alkalicoccobacillus gibsonii]MBM0066779.1 hypothetical protein [Alkalicoccobacillus gibsonii]